MTDKKTMLNADSQRDSTFERMKSSIAEAMQPGDTKSTVQPVPVPPDEQETNLPFEEDKKPLYGQRLGSGSNGNAGSSARASAAGAATSKKDQGIVASAEEMVEKALGRK